MGRLLSLTLFPSSPPFLSTFLNLFFLSPSLGTPSLNQLGSLKSCKLLQWVWAKPQAPSRQTGAYLSQIEQLWRHQFCVFSFKKVNVVFLHKRNENWAVQERQDAACVPKIRHGRQKYLAGRRTLKSGTAPAAPRRCVRTPMLQSLVKAQDRLLQPVEPPTKIFCVVLARFVPAFYSRREPPCYEERLNSAKRARSAA